MFCFQAAKQTCSIMLREDGLCEGGGLQGQAGQWVEDHIGRHRGVGSGHELAARVGDEACVNTQGLREETALLKGLLQEGMVDLK